MTAIACAGTGGFRAFGEDEDNLPVKLGCLYDTRDPLAWSMWFQLGEAPRVFWTFGRDLMLGALENHLVNGEGDVSVTRVATGGGHTLLFRLTNPDTGEDALVVTPAGPILALVRQSLLLVPAGSESVDVDAAVALILSGGVP